MAPYKYDTPTNRFAGSIADLIQQQGQIRANAAQQAGQAQAQAAAQRGQIWGGAVGSIGQMIGAIPQQMQQQKAQALRTEADALELRKARRGEADVTALDQAFKLGDRDAILNSLPGHLRPTVTKQFAEADTSAGKLQKLQGEVEQANNEYLAGLGSSIAEHGYDLGATGLALMHARNTYEKTGNTTMLARVDEIAQQLQDNPDSIKQVVDGVIKLSPKRTELMQTAEHQAATEAHATTAAEETARHNQAMEGIQTQTAGRAEAQAAEAARHNKAMEGLGAQRNATAAAGNADAIELSPEGKKAAALTYAKTGQLPPMGMGKAGAKVRAEIINLAAETYPNLDVASNKADFQANQASLTQLQKQRDAVGAFEQTAMKNIDIFLDASSKLVDTGSPLLNQPLRMITGRVLGSKDQAAVDAARVVAVNEIAKITSNPNLSGTLSDSARHEVEAFNPREATLAQSIAVMKILKQDMENRPAALDKQIEGIRARIAKGNEPAKPAGPKEGTEGTVNGKAAVWKTVDGVTGWYAK